MFEKSRLIVALGLVLALGVSATAFGTAATNDAGVKFDIKAKKLDKKKRSKVAMLLGVTNSDTDIPAGGPDNSANPQIEDIAISKNVKVNLNKAPKCPVTFGNGTPKSQVEAQCGNAIIGEGQAEVKDAPGSTFATPTVTVVNGDASGQSGVVQLVTEDQDDLGASAPTVRGVIVKSDEGSAYGQELQVNPAPETGPFKITLFEATLFKNTGVVTANCKDKTPDAKRTVTYKDGTSEETVVSDTCKRKPSKKGGK